MRTDLEQMVSRARNEARALIKTLQVIKAQPEAKRVIILTGDDDTEVLANECDTVLIFVEGIAEWEEA